MSWPKVPFRNSNTCPGNKGASHERVSKTGYVECHPAHPSGRSIHSQAVCCLYYFHVLFVFVFVYIWVFPCDFCFSEMVLKKKKKERKKLNHENNGTRREDFAKSGILKNLNILKFVLNIQKYLL